jgi:hypothetical protein
MIDDDEDAWPDEWPRNGDRLFLESGWARDARIATDVGERFYRLATRYKRAGDILIDSAAADPADRNNIIYPALFCYRQCIELCLKRLLVNFGPADSDNAKSHDHRALWERFERLAADVG